MPARVTLVVPSAFSNLARDQPVTAVRCALVRHGQAELPVDLPGESGGGEDGGGGAGGGSVGGGSVGGGGEGGGGDGSVEASEPPQSSAKSVAAILPCVPILRIVSAVVRKSRDWAPRLPFLREDALGAVPASANLSAFIRKPNTPRL